MLLGGSLAGIKQVRYSKYPMDEAAKATLFLAAIVRSCHISCSEETRKIPHMPARGLGAGLARACCQQKLPLCNQKQRGTNSNHYPQPTPYTLVPTA